MTDMVGRLALIGLLLVPLPAFAQWATITSNVNMRAGPGRDYEVTTWLPRGTKVNVAQCAAGRPWCDVVWGRRRGWVHESYLGGLSRARVPSITIGAGGAHDEHAPRAA
jgi:uncharacterized protein YraI